MNQISICFSFFCGLLTFCVFGMVLSPMLLIVGPLFREENNSSKTNDLLTPQCYNQSSWAVCPYKRISSSLGAREFHKMFGCVYVCVWWNLYVIEAEHVYSAGGQRHRKRSFYFIQMHTEKVKILTIRGKIDILLPLFCPLYLTFRISQHKNRNGV